MNISINSNISLNDGDVSFNISNVETNNIGTDRDAMIKDLMQLYSKHNLSKVALEDIANVMNSVPGANVQIPTTKYLIFKEFSQHSSHIVNKHILCSQCKEFSVFSYANPTPSTCSLCGTEISKLAEFFVHLSAESQLKHIVHKNFDEIMKYKQRVTEKQCDTIEDVYDGQVIKSIKTLNFIY